MKAAAASDEDRQRWSDASLAATLLAIDPAGLGGACLRAAHGPVRDRWLEMLRCVLPDPSRMRRVPAHISVDRLIGGLDLTATLRAGRAVAQTGVLGEVDGGIAVLAMAERWTAPAVALVTAALDTGTIALERSGIASRRATRFGVVALDEGIGEDEFPRVELLDRLAFLLDLTALRVDLGDEVPADLGAVARARARLSSVVVEDDVVELLCVTALRLGIASIRASLLAVRAARALAALGGRTRVEECDAASAARLVLAPRATTVPPMEADAEQAQDPADAPEDVEPPKDESGATEPSPPDEREQGERDDADSPPEDRVLEAVLAAIPKGLLDRLRDGKALAQSARSEGRVGAARASLLRGRPAGVRRGDPGGGVRLNLIETLRAAAPWQRLRHAARGGEALRRIEIRREDFHVTRFQQRTQTTTIFVVDASGSSALNRLAEAKGAVELLLADCYVRRDQVAVISFRGRGAELLLPPTRSLVRAKRNLAGLPGGAGTPMATAIDAAVELALRVRRAGQTPTLVFLTDGQANVARDGSGGRERAAAEALAAARCVRSERIMTLFVDISVRAQPQAQSLADAMNAHYLPLPYADAASLSAAVKRVGSA